VRDPWSGGVVDIPVAHGVRGHRRGSRCVPHTQQRLLLRLPLSDSSAKHWHAEREPYCDVHAQSLGAPRPPAVSLAAVLRMTRADVISLTATGWTCPLELRNLVSALGRELTVRSDPAAGAGLSQKRKDWRASRLLSISPAGLLHSARHVPLRLIARFP
jgi:hypothetical protein